MRIYLVGGAVRDELLGRPVRERDWVVVGATEQELLGQGFRRVGRDFPVFLHPLTKEEYALARTERKSARGHTGFVVHAAPEVTLEADLRRRDLTINALARDVDGSLVDPYGGLADLDARKLKHVSEAFIEDPLRVFRVARFAAQLGDFGFTVAPETLELMRAMATRGELADLSAERVYNEWAKALAAPARARFFEVLFDCGAMEPWFRELVPHRAAVIAATLRSQASPIIVAIVAIARAVGGQVPTWLERLKAPRLQIDASTLALRHGTALSQVPVDAESALSTLEACDAFRRGERFAVLCDVFAFDSNAAADAWRRLANGLAAQRIDVEGRAGAEAARYVRGERLQLVAHLLKS